MAISKTKDKWEEYGQLYKKNVINIFLFYNVVLVL